MAQQSATAAAQELQRRQEREHARREQMEAVPDFAWAHAAAGLPALASQAAVSLVNNQGDVGQTLKDLGDSDSIKQIVTAMLTAGTLNAVGGTEWMRVVPATAKLPSSPLAKVMVSPQV